MAASTSANDGLEFTPVTELDARGSPAHNVGSDHAGNGNGGGYGDAGLGSKSLPSPTCLEQESPSAASIDHDCFGAVPDVTSPPGAVNASPSPTNQDRSCGTPDSETMSSSFRVHGGRNDSDSESKAMQGSGSAGTRWETGGGRPGGRPLLSVDTSLTHSVQYSQRFQGITKVGEPPVPAIVPLERPSGFSDDDLPGPGGVSMRTHRIVRQLVTPMIRPDSSDPKENGVLALITAAKCGAVDVLNHLIVDEHVNPNTVMEGPGGYMETPLIAACREGELEAARLLLSEGADANIAVDDGETALLVVAEAIHNPMPSTGPGDGASTFLDTPTSQAGSTFSYFTAASRPGTSGSYVSGIGSPAAGGGGVHSGVFGSSQWSPAQSSPLARHARPKSGESIASNGPDLFPVASGSVLGSPTLPGARQPVRSAPLSSSPLGRESLRPATKVPSGHHDLNADAEPKPFGAPSLAPPRGASSSLRLERQGSRLAPDVSQTATSSGALQRKEQDRPVRHPVVKPLSKALGLKFVRLLLTENADVNAQRHSDGRTALMLSARAGALDVCQALTEGGAFVDILDKRTFRPKTAAAYAKHDKLIWRVITKRNGPRQKLLSQARLATRQRDFAVLSRERALANKARTEAAMESAQHRLWKAQYDAYIADYQRKWAIDTYEQLEKERDEAAETTAKILAEAKELERKMMFECNAERDAALERVRELTLAESLRKSSEIACCSLM